MEKTVKMLMKYRYRQEWMEKLVTLADVAQWTRSGKYAQRVNAVRGKGLVPTEVGLADGEMAAQWLPVVQPSVGEDDTYTGLVLLSFRTDGGTEVLTQLRRQVELWPQTLMAFLGSSGQSLKVLIAYQREDGSLPAGAEDVALFRQYAYKRAADYALGATGMRPEEVPHDGSEHFRLSCDEGLYLNTAVVPIVMSQPTVPLTDSSATVVDRSAGGSLDTEVLPGMTRRQMDVTKFNFICRRLAYSELRKMEDHLMRLAVSCCRAGIDQELATLLTIQLLEAYEQEALVRSTFSAAYETHKMGMANPVERSMMHQLLLEQFLQRRYLFRCNSVTGEMEYQERFRYEMAWRPLTQEARNDINNAAIREGIKVWPQDLERILVSNRTDTYDPVRQWLERLPQWDGRDRLGEMAARVPAKSSFWTDDFKTWMRSMVSQWRAGRHAMYGAQMVLMLVGPQGTRKSTFMRMLLPPELMPFYIDRIDFTNRKEALRALSRFLLINIDEYDQVSKAQTAFLKHLIQRADVKERKLYSTTFEQQQRYAAFCATTNALMPLKDESGSRRYLVVEVDSAIDTDTQGQHAIDYAQLYAQIVSELDSGMDYAFTGERERRIVQQNAEYYEVPNVVSLFDDLFRFPESGDETLLLSPSEILTRIRDMRKVNVVTQSNATLIGSYLSRKGFRKGQGAQRRCYAVALR